MGIAATLGKIAKLRPDKVGLFRFSDPNYLNLHFANGAHVALTEWQGLYSYYSSSHLFETRFSEVFTEAAARDPHVSPEVVRLRIYNAVKFSEIAICKPGDILFCGVSWGVSPFAVMKSHKTKMEGRTCYLADAFEGTNGYGDRETRKAYNTNYLEVEEAISEFGTSVVIKGYVPDSLDLIHSSRFCFVQLNLSDPLSEVAALEWIGPRMPPGGIVLIDCLGTYHKDSDKFVPALDRLGFMTIPLMNGQAACFKI